VVLALGAAAAYFGHLVLPVPSAAPEAEPLTLTVLPFETVGPGAEQGHLARGISSDLMTDLASLSGLRLINAPAGGSTRYVISGSVQREGETLRINIRLAEARTGEQVWSQRVERPFGDLFAIQSEITHSVMQHLPGKISDAERRRLAKRHTDSLEAYDYFLRGQAKFLVRRSEENRQARAFYGKALELDPKFARAYAGLAMTHAMDYRYQGAAAPSGALDRALELAESARMIDPDIPELYWALGFVHTQSRRHHQAIQALQKAIELNRSYADAYALMGGIYTYVGEPARSIPLLRTALRLNPDGGYLYYLLLGRAYLFENDAQQALINLREALARNPDDVETRVFLAAALVANGDRPAAEWEAELIRAYEQGFSARQWLKTYPMTSAPLQQRLSKLLAELQL
jgi:TolB-like protein/Tfp pilus assembly protein PilF